MDVTDKTILALPSKGRMKDASDAYMKRLGLKISSNHGGRGYHDSVAGWPNVLVKRLPASVIADECLSGEAHFGITGLDLIAERDSAYNSSVSHLAKLNFGHADLVVAVPKFWLDVDYVGDLLRVAIQMQARLGRRVKIATKYKNLTAQFLENNGFIAFELIDSDGATEAAPANNVADLIVDISSSGATLEANNLKILEDGLILKSQANFWQSQHANWHANAEKLRMYFAEKIA